MSEISFEFAIELSRERTTKLLAAFFERDETKRLAALAELARVSPSLGEALSKLSLSWATKGRVVHCVGDAPAFNTDAFERLAAYFEDLAPSSLFAILFVHNVGEAEFRALRPNGLTTVYATGAGRKLDRLFRNPATALRRGRRAYENGEFGDTGAASVPVCSSEPAPSVAPERRIMERLRLREGSKYSFLDLDGNSLDLGKLDGATQFVADRAFVRRGGDGAGWSLIDPSGKRLRSRDIATPALYRDGLAVVQLRDGSAGTMDLSGQLIARFPNELRPLETFHWDETSWTSHADGRAPALQIAKEPPLEIDAVTGELRIKRGGCNGWVNLDGAWICAPIYSKVGPFSEGLAAFERIERGSGKVYGWVDTEGREVAVIAGAASLPAPFSRGVSTISEPVLRGYDRAGKELFCKPEYVLRRPFWHGVARVSDQVTRKLVSIGTDAEPIAPFHETAHGAEAEEPYLAARSGGRWGVCDAGHRFWPLAIRISAESWIRATVVPGVVELQTDARWGTDAFMELSGKVIWSRRPVT